jgi:hypothetical protein
MFLKVRDLLADWVRSPSQNPAHKFQQLPNCQGFPQLQPNQQHCVTQHNDDRSRSNSNYNEEQEENRKSSPLPRKTSRSHELRRGNWIGVRNLLGAQRAWYQNQPSRAPRQTNLATLFEQMQYRSFRRRLNMWHFHRISEGPNKGIFVHPYFVKQDRDLSALMSRHIDFDLKLVSNQLAVTS